VEARYSAPVQTGPGAHQASCALDTRSFSEVQHMVHGTDHPPPPNAKLKERVESYLNFPSRPSWSALEGTLPFYIISTCLYQLSHYRPGLALGAAGS
jgi:hypothetical protein